MADEDSRAGIRYASRELLQYTESVHLGESDAQLAAFRSAGEVGIPEIMVGRSEAKFIGQLLSLISAKTVVEIGTLAGYSAISMARYLKPGGHIYSLEFEPAHAELARKNISAAGLTQSITVLQGAAIDVLPNIVEHGPFDAVFIDADKQNYDRYGIWAAANTRKGGLLLGDNAFLFGQLLDDSAEARAMRRFHEDATRHYDTSCIPTPDGLLLGIRQ